MIISFVFHSFISRRSFNFEITRVISQQTALSQLIFIKNFPCQCNRKLTENDVENIQTDSVRVWEVKHLSYSLENRSVYVQEQTIFTSIQNQWRCICFNKIAFSLTLISSRLFWEWWLIWRSVILEHDKQRNSKNVLI